MIKNIIFDIGNVLVGWDPDPIYRKYFNYDDAAIQRFYTETEIFLANRELDRGKPFAEMHAELAANFPHYHEELFCWRDKWEEMITGPIDGSVDILKSLHQRNYNLFGLTNWSHETFPIIRTKHDFFNYFKDIVVSGEVKCIKPDHQIYRILLQKHRLNSEESVFIDDTADNVTAATELGINGIIFKSPEQLVEDLKKLAIASAH